MPQSKGMQAGDGLAVGWSLRPLARSSRLVLLGLTILLLLLGGVMFSTIHSQREARSHVFHEVESILALHVMREAVINAETGERGFLLNGEDRYLEPMRGARTDFDQARKTAGTLIGSSPYEGEAQSLNVLDRLVNERFAVIDQNIALLQSGRRDEAISPARSTLGKNTMDALRIEINRLEAEEQAQRKGAITVAERNEGRMAPLLALLGTLIVALVLFAMLLERRHSLASARAQQAEALRDANARAELLARELNHRVKNVFAVILAIVSLTGRRREADRSTMNELRARIHALSIAHAASQGQIGSETADLGDLIRRVLEPYASHQDGRLLLDGPVALLPVRMITPLGMIIHELATNAAKYGAFSTREGQVAIAWRCESMATGEKEISLSWIESGGPALEGSSGEVTTSGFGSTMLDLAARQLDGTLHRDWTGKGAQAHLRFPLRD